MEASPRELAGNIVDVVSGRVFPGVLELSAGRIVRLTPTDGPYDRYLIPGFVDAHVHIESSLLSPAAFAHAALRHGTIATVSDPHEIANVLGTAGVHYMLDDAATTPLKIAFGAPSCVPATAFETAGAVLGPEEVAGLLDDPRIRYLSEMMNYPGVLSREPAVLAKLDAARSRNKPIDGHAPGLRGAALRAYVAAGISTDHECTDRDEAEEKLHGGLKVMIREGSAARDFEALSPLLGTYAERLMFCTDDLHPDDLEAGHIDRLVRRGLAQGVDCMTLLRVASLNPVRHYRLPVGLLQVGDPADLLVVDNLEALTVLAVYVDGQLVAAHGQTLVPLRASGHINRFEARPKVPADFKVAARGDTLRVIAATDGSLHTGALRLPASLRAREAVADPARDLLKLAVINRYREAPPAVAFITGFGLQRGALASSVAHDAHNVVAVGTSDEDLCRAVNLVIAERGGLAFVDGGEEALLPLPIAGLMSDRPAAEVAREYQRLTALVHARGCTLRAPYMTLSFMALLVIPSLKLSDRGLFDGAAFAFTELFV